MNMIVTKNFEDLVEYAQCHPKLLLLLEYVKKYFYKKFQRNVCVTEIGRTVEEQRIICKKNKIKYYISMHMLTPILAIDIRTINLTIEQIEGLVKNIKQNWQFNFTKTKHCCKYHRVKMDEYHLHLQVCDETEYIGKKNII